MKRLPHLPVSWSPGLLACLFLVGCSKGDMVDQPKLKDYGANDFFADSANVRPTVPGTVARGQLRTDEHLFAGKQDGQTARDFPFPITFDDLKRGQERYDIYCAVCHGKAGYGDGMIVRRGFTPPPSYHIDRLRDEGRFEAARPGHIFQVITNGFGAMYSYNDRISPKDRWRIAAYIKALQRSQDPAAPVTLASAPTTRPAGR